MIRAKSRRRQTTDASVTDDLLTCPRKYRDERFDAIAVKLFPGEHYVTDAVDEMLVTVLGSCVAACIRDPQTRVGGMNHFMLPESFGDWGDVSDGMRYGNVAMERLINDILARGGARRRLEIKVFGGANVLNGMAKIGHRNADFVEDYLAAEHLPIAAYHLRGSLPRRVHYFPVTGRVMLLELPRADHDALVRNETSYKTRIQVEPVAGSVEIF
ncbi:MAG: chemoreceptor glutamine deamidase CheD [Bradyrhizobium sp.]|jgi:chemotaxis protein CheD|uniref:Probable chemoreceptor glutamine deamidase CheD n=1 Tax=Bradyrhizobium denitrificans TaxID=2734912 RepID=A0ABS5G3G7_9BRAD|nr:MULTISPECIES: chemoreceptor glutamine deamidase CheD [Bradyrhizobium]MBR1135624.1 chemoreceptor glutamine deamidase CheD [Bradyrhizobium denitrificans]MDU0957602.1 chemoreceptor glutamine deamidase CheD [Bradyrhizobium sp.]MDU1494779.1 chemoreceptor glutamine deamidase CheD [Bradyrhizobium sp.]MDU1544900.1 chemoreceptor glutamine deamidase CheD [Bradyrhizobium sp.]MDU1669014.1 chemoreceptor glutamine deamidase CheD [Bradyrhizobium sp.]